MGQRSAAPSASAAGVAGWIFLAATDHSSYCNHVIEMAYFLRTTEGKKMLDDANFSEFVARERARLDTERGALNDLIAGYQRQLSALSREYAAVAAYEQAKTGKSAAAATTGRRARSGTRRQAVLDAISAAPDGLTRKELMLKFGVIGDNSGAMSISNALSQMRAAGQISRSDDGRWMKNVGQQLRVAAE